MSVEEGKRIAAYRAVDNHVKQGMTIGVGSGSTVVYAVERLKENLKSLQPLRCVPTSFQSRQLCVAAGLTVTDLETCPQLDVCIDGADEVDSERNLIKGGGGCQVQEKVVASCAGELIIIADFRKQSTTLGTAWKKGVPIEVVPMAWKPVELQLKAMGGTPKLRMASQKAGPVVTDNGGFIIDCDFGKIDNPLALDVKIRAIVGVVETGLFVGMASKCYFGQEDGSVIEI